MVSFETLHKQNHEITEISNVFRYLIKDRPMCDTQIACDLFFNYTKKTKEHMELVDKELCGRLISHDDQSVKNTASRFLSGSTEIKRIFADYIKDYCSERQRRLNIKDYDAFVTETDQMFELVLDRIQRETEHLYPLIRKLDRHGQQTA
jgi:hypothetical protein